MAFHRPHFNGGYIQDKGQSYRAIVADTSHIRGAAPIQRLE